MTPTLNAVVEWRNCPPAIWQFATGRITAISGCGQFIKLGFIGHWVSVAECDGCNDPIAVSFCQKYQPVLQSNDRRAA